MLDKTYLINHMFMIKIKVIYFDTLIPSYHTSYSHIGIYSCIGLIHVYLHEYFVFSFLIYYFVLSTLHAIPSYDCM